MKVKSDEKLWGLVLIWYLLDTRTWINNKEKKKAYQCSLARRYETSILSFLNHVGSYPIFHTADKNILSNIHVRRAFWHRSLRSLDLNDILLTERTERMLLHFTICIGCTLGVHCPRLSPWLPGTKHDRDSLLPVREKILPFARLHELKLASYVSQASHIHAIEVHLHHHHYLTSYSTSHQSPLWAVVLLTTRFRNQDFQSGEDYLQTQIQGANQSDAIVFIFTLVTIDYYIKFTAFVMMDMMIHRAQSHSLLYLHPLTASPQTCQKPSTSCHGYWHMWLHLIRTQKHCLVEQRRGEICMSTSGLTNLARYQSIIQVWMFECQLFLSFPYRLYWQPFMSQQW